MKFFGRVCVSVFKNSLFSNLYQYMCTLSVEGKNHVCGL